MEDRNLFASLIDEYGDPRELVDLLERLKDLDETQLEAYETIINELGWDREEVLDMVENWEFDAIEWNDGSIEETVGYYYANLNEYTTIDDGTISKYFDYEAYGRDICLKSDKCDNGRTIFIIH